MSFSSRKVPEGLYHRLLECAQCDLLYASPVPTFESLTDAYRQADYASGEEARYAAATYAKVLETIAPQLPDLRARPTSARATARSSSGSAPQGSRRRSASSRPRRRWRRRRRACGTRSAPSRSAPDVLPDESFTLVSCMQTIEHVLDPLEVCRDAVRALAPRGAVLIACHDRRALSARVLKQRSPIFDIEHVQLFSPRSIRARCSAAGLERIEVRPLRNRYPLRYWLQLAPLPGAPRGGALGGCCLPQSGSSTSPSASASAISSPSGTSPPREAPDSHVRPADLERRRPARGCG